MVISDVKSLNSIFKDLYEEKVSSLIPDGVTFRRKREVELDCGLVVMYNRDREFDYFIRNRGFCTREEAKQYISKHKTKVADIL